MTTEQFTEEILIKSHSLGIKDEVFDLSKVDPWFLAQIEDIVSSEMQVNGASITDIAADDMFD